MKLTPAAVRTVQIGFWVSALRGPYDDLSLYWHVIRADRKLTKRQQEAHLEAYALVSKGVIEQIRDAVPAEIRKEVVRGYRKSVKERP